MMRSVSSRASVTLQPFSNFDKATRLTAGPQKRLAMEAFITF
jgi:hypothetical protein